MDEIKVGSPVWIFDSNYRVYEKDKNGRSLSGGPIWREHWVKHVIVRETSQSWVVRAGCYEIKIPKKAEKRQSMSVCFSEDDIWVDDNHYKLSRQIEKCRDYAVLKQIADLLDRKAAQDGQ